jgi:RNA polymerase sigma-70 factor (sigma-E family)
LRQQDVDRDGGEADFAEYAASRWPTLVRSAIFLGCSSADAEDVAQEALTRCLVKWDKVTAARHRDAYVSAILLNVFRDSRRRRGRREVPVASVPDRSVPDSSERTGDTAAIESALGGLSAGQREVLVLRFYLQLTEEQTADALSVALGTVKSRTARALAALATDTNLIELRGGPR